jgi:hypothetical protein
MITAAAATAPPTAFISLFLLLLRIKPPCIHSFGLFGILDRKYRSLKIAGAVAPKELSAER